jgi:hypothetical protein
MNMSKVVFEGAFRHRPFMFAFYVFLFAGVEGELRRYCEHEQGAS